MWCWYEKAYYSEIKSTRPDAFKLKPLLTSKGQTEVVVKSHEKESANKQLDKLSVRKILPIHGKIPIKIE